MNNYEKIFLVLCDISSSPSVYLVKAQAPGFQKEEGFEKRRLYNLCRTIFGDGL